MNARSSTRLRQHSNLHSEYSDPCQRLFNAIQPGSYIPPHRHAAVPRVETMVAIRGCMALVVFDDFGNIDEVIPFGPCGESTDLAAGVEVSAYCWHMVVALHPDSILLEVKAGPYDPHRPKERAPWAPEEGAAGAEQYLRRIRSEIDAVQLVCKAEKTLIRR
jgi:cupin fold WbuC family metalloprotein